MRDDEGVRIRVAILATLVVAGSAGTLTVLRARERPAPQAAPPTSTTEPTTTTSTTTFIAPILQAGAAAQPVGDGQGPPVTVGLSPCAQDRVWIVVTTATATVLPGQTITAVARQRNDGDQPCRWPGDVRFTWRDANGSQFESARSDVEPVTTQWQPGQVLEQRSTWDQRFDNGSAAAVGYATVTVSWGPAGGQANQAVAPFLVVNGPPPGPPVSA